MSEMGRHNCTCRKEPAPIKSGGSVLHHIRPADNSNDPDRTIIIRLASTDGERAAASMVVNRRYGAKGYGADHRLIEDRNKVTFTASSKTEIFGTLTLSVDSKLGLAADRTFPAEVDRIRQSSQAKVCELTKFAFHTAPDSRPYLASLFHIVYLYGTQHFDCSDLLIEVNPRHVRFYETMLGFKPIGEARTNSEVDAPAQLMHILVSEIGRNINRYAGEVHSARHSLYPYFFSSSEEAGLRKRLAQFARGDAEPREAICPMHRAVSQAA